MYTKIKEFGELVAQANKTGSKEIKLDRKVAVELLSEITKVLVDRLEQIEATSQPTSVQNVSGGGFSA